MTVVVGKLADLERETLAILDARREDIEDGQLNGVPWLQALLEQSGDLLRRLRSAEARRSA